VIFTLFFSAAAAFQCFPEKRNPPAAAAEVRKKFRRSMFGI
jgi:hypothetical protein